MNAWALSMSPEEEQVLYREWGMFFTKKQILDKAERYFATSLELNKSDSKALHYRGKCRRQMAEPMRALDDAQKALNIDPSSQPFNLELIDTIYQLNKIEEAKHTCSELSTKFTGLKVLPFRQREELMDENFKDSLGVSLRRFIIQNEKIIYRVFQEMVKEGTIDPRPTWKILFEDGKCDVQSIPDIEEEILHPREILRRNRAFRIYYQIYLGRPWADVLFLKGLCGNQDLLLRQSHYSTPLLEDLTDIKYKAVSKITKMLHTRDPLYNKMYKNCPNEILKRKKTEDYLYRIQLLTHNNMLKMLRTMLLLRRARKLVELENFVEDIMGQYALVKTNRLMPWKFEFLNEVYNILALAYLDHAIQIPSNFRTLSLDDRLRALFKLPMEMYKEPPAIVFGKREAESHTEEKILEWQRSLIARLTRRTRFTQHPIERAYISYRLAYFNLKQNRVDSSVVHAGRSYKEAESVQSKIWSFLASLLICKANAAVGKYDQIPKLLKRATKDAIPLRNKAITRFLRVCLNVNKAIYKARKKAQAQEDARKSE